MTDDATTKDDGPLALDWSDAALEAWELEVDKSATAESSPFPLGPNPTPVVAPDLNAPENDTRAPARDRRVPPPPPPAALKPRAGAVVDARGPNNETRAREHNNERPRMYQPPSPAELARLESGSRPTPSVADVAAALAADVSDNELSPISEELLEALAPLEESSHPPPAYAHVETRAGAREQYVETLRPFAPAPALFDGGQPTPVVVAGEEPVLEVLLQSSELLLEPAPAEEESSPRAESLRRIARLEALARRQSEPEAAELYSSAAELAEELGEPARAEALYERALAAAPKRPAALKALARLAFRAGDLHRYEQLLERLTELPLAARERARLLATLALTRWIVQRDAPGALRAANAAHELAPEQLGPALLLARIASASEPGQVDATLVQLAQRTEDRALAGTWLVTAGRALALRGDHERARALFVRAAADDPFAFDAQLSLAHTEHTLGAHADAARALLRTLESFDIGPVAEAVRRRAAHMLALEGARAESVELLEHASDDISLRTAAQIALAGADAELKRSAVEAWVHGTDGPERALALITQAELTAERGELDEAENALELAALADPKQTLVPVLREALARRAGNPARLAEIAASEEAGRGALAAAAKLALSHHADDEFTWLSEAAEEESGVAAHLLAIDASAELARKDEQRRLLHEASERGAAPARALSLLALAELERQRGEQGAQREALEQALLLAPREASVLRAYARARPGPERTADAYRREAEGASGAQAAFAYLRTAFALEGRPGERLEAILHAYETIPSYLPAGWALHREARRQGELPRLAELHTREAERALDARTRIAHLVRAALIRGSDDSEAAAAQLTRALELAPDDPVLAELVVRLGDASPAAARVAALERMAGRVAEPFRRAYLLAAAGTLEDQGRLEEASEHYAAVLRDHPGDPISTASTERIVEARASANAREQNMSEASANGREPADRATRTAELLEAKRRAANEASTERARTRALEELLLYETDPERSFDIGQQLLALVPSHPLGLRVLERSAMERDEHEHLAALELRLLDSGRGPRDQAARLRLLHVLTALAPANEGKSAELDQKLLAHAASARESSWLGRQLMSAAIAQGSRELTVRAVELLAQETDEPVERASLAVLKGWLTLELAPGQVAGALSAAVASYPEHPTHLELAAEARRAVGEFEPAAQGFEAAAEDAQASGRAAHLWARAASVWETLKRPERALAALQHAAARDLDHPGVRDRLSALLQEQGDVEGLIALTRTQLAHGGDSQQAYALRRSLADLHEQRGEREQAERVLREALSQAPDSLPGWRDLARFAARAHNHNERVEALTTITRLSRDPLELRDTFLELGEVYEHDLSDPTRAEAAYQRALKLGRYPKALERLAALYRREGKREQALETLTQLAHALPEGAQKREVTLQLAGWREELGDLRGAEELLETLRRATPTDAPLLRALTELLRRTHAHTALAMHLNRAAGDLRQAIADHFDDPELWRTLVEVLGERERLDVASQCVRTAAALGVELGELHGGLAPSALEARAGARNEGESRGIGAAALSELLDDLVFPESAPASLRILFRHAAEALNRSAPLDLRVLGAERIDKRHPLRNVIAEQARWVSHRDIEVFTSAELPYAFVPIQDSPIQLLVGRGLLDTLSVDEQRFLVARALKIARAQMSISCRLSPPQLELLLHGLVRTQVASHAPAFLELATLDDAARRLAKQLSRRALTEIAPHVLELTYAGVPRFDAASVYGVASVAGSRAGLLATADVRAALSALVKLSGAPDDDTLPPSAAARVAQVEEACELVSFAISDAHFEARARAGRETR